MPEALPSALPQDSSARVPRPLDSAQPLWRRVVEVLLIFAVFSLHGAWPAPDVNEAHYLSKAKHYWNPTWCQSDFFVNTADAHQVFYWTFGWLTRYLSLPITAWVGRLLTWGLLAFAWRRLSWAVVPRNWWAVLAAVLFVSLNENAHMAGEWIVGGVEAKGFAYVLVLLGMEAVVRGRWNWAWALLGAATGMHAIVGGWSVLAAGVAWLAARGERAPLKSMLPGLTAGLLLSLPGILIALALTRGVDPQTVAQANSIYVWQRLPHHLAADRFQIGFPSRHMLLWTLWLVLITISTASAAQRRLRWMVSTAMFLTAIGYALVLIGRWNPDFAASMLRFYWFRMSDVFIPLGVTLVGLNWLRQALEQKPPTMSAVENGSPVDPRPDGLAGCQSRRWRAAHFWLAGLIFVAIGDLALQFGHLPPELAVFGLPAETPRADKGVVYDDWRDVCRWSADHTPANARFLTPRMASTFRWYAGRGEVVSWKDIPQNADGIVEWWRRLADIWGMGSPTGTIESLELLPPTAARQAANTAKLAAAVAEHRQDEVQAKLTLEQPAAAAEHLAELANTYKAGYAIVQLLPNVPRLPMPAEYSNNSYVVYRFSLDR